MTEGPRPGDILLFRLDKDVVRPLIVLEVHGEETAEPSVTGILFIDPTADRHTAWIQGNCFYSPDPHQHTLLVQSVFDGKEVGQWHLPGHVPADPSEHVRLSAVYEAMKASRKARTP